MMVVKPKQLAVLLVCAALTGTSFAEWKKEVTDDGVEVYTQPVTGTHLTRARASVRINAPLHSVLGAIFTRPTMKDWFFNVKEADTLTTNNPDGRLSYFVLKSPWPIDDRDVVLNVDVRMDPHGAVTLTADSTDPALAPSRQDRVRMPSMHSMFTATPLDATTTQVDFQAVADPGGGIPDWLVAAFASQTPHYTLKNLREYLEKGHLDTEAVGKDKFANYAFSKIGMTAK